MLAGGVRALAIHGVQQDLALPTEVVVELDHPSGQRAGAALAGTARPGTRERGWTQLAWYRAGVEHVNLGAQFDPAFALRSACARPYGRLWFTARARKQRRGYRPPRATPAAGLEAARERDVGGTHLRAARVSGPRLHRDRSSGAAISMPSSRGSSDGWHAATPSTASRVSAGNAVTSRGTSTALGDALGDRE